MANGELLKGVDTNQRLAAFATRLREAGIDFVSRYYRRGPGTRHGNMDRAEAEALLSAGIMIFPVMQNINNKLSYFTLENAVKDARAGVARAREAGQPEQTAVAMAFDTDFTPQTALSVALPYGIEFSKVVRDGGYVPGSYGDKQAVETLVGHHVQGYGDVSDVRWATNARGWDTRFEYVHIRQVSLPHPMFGGALSVDDDLAVPYAAGFMWRPDHLKGAA